MIRDLIQVIELSTSLCLVVKETLCDYFFFFKQKTAYEIGLGIPAEPLFRSIQMDTSVNAANQVVSVGADIAFDADPKFFACLVRFESSSVPTTLPTAYDVYPLDGRHDGGYYTVKDCVTIDVLPRTPGNNEIGRAVQQECRDRSRMPSSA